MKTHSALSKTVGAFTSLALIVSLFGFAFAASVQQARAATMAEQILCYVDQELGPDVPFDPQIDYCNSGEPTDPGEMPQCFDGDDNDGDGLVDMADPGCSGPTDDSEAGNGGGNGTTTPMQCEDTLDNDSDGVIDLNDPDCSNADDNTESGTMGTSTPATSTATVSIHKYVGDDQATSGNTDGDSFMFSASWDNEGGSGVGNGTFTLNSGNSYHAVTSALTLGSSYTFMETTSDMSSSSNTLPAGAECQDGMWRLMGYRTGTSLASAEQASLSTSSPNFTDLSQNQHVIVVNEECDDDGGSNGDEPTLTIIKNAVGGNGTFNFAINGAGTTSLSTANGWATSTVMTLGTGSSTVSEVQSNGWTTTGISCMEGTQSIGTSTGTGAYMFSAANGDDIVCTFTNTATSTGTTTDAALHVDSIDAQDTSAIANDTYEDGWRYLFHITTPNDEPNLSMRFSDWFVSSSSSATIPVANNMRVSSAQASSTSAITLTASNAYSTPPMMLVTDLDPSMPGRQVEVLVEVKIPHGTANETYTTTYGVQTLPE